MKLTIETESNKVEIEDKHGVTIDVFLEAWIAGMVGVSFCIDTAYDAILDKADEIRIMRGEKN